MTKEEKQQLSEIDICDLFITPAITNFDRTLPAPHAAIAQSLLKDPYELTRALPSELVSSLPSIEDIENELTDNLEKGDNA